jgi:hypothetical protein
MRVGAMLPGGDLLSAIASCVFHFRVASSHREQLERARAVELIAFFHSGRAPFHHGADGVEHLFGEAAAVEVFVRRSDVGLDLHQAARQLDAIRVLCDHQHPAVVTRGKFRGINGRRLQLVPANAICFHREVEFLRPAQEVLHCPDREVIPDVTDRPGPGVASCEFSSERLPHCVGEFAPTQNLKTKKFFQGKKNPARTAGLSHRICKRLRPMRQG